MDTLRVVSNNNIAHKDRKWQVFGALIAIYINKYEH
jgi:hypothetical protein